MFALNMARMGGSGLLNAITMRRSNISNGAYNLARILFNKRVTGISVSVRSRGEDHNLKNFADFQFKRFYTSCASIMTNRNKSQDYKTMMQRIDYTTQRCLASGSKDGAKDAKSVQKIYEKHCIVPDVIQCAPEDVINICFPAGASVDLGNKLTPTNVKDEPSLFEWFAEEKSYYTILKLDPDAPCRENPEQRHWLHWLIVNVAGCDFCSGYIAADYVGAGPPKGTGPHRYVFLVYKQQCDMNFKEKAISNNTVTGRPNFDLGAFTQKYRLGQPVAGNFYIAEYDDYVPILYHQLGVK